MTSLGVVGVTYPLSRNELVSIKTSAEWLYSDVIMKGGDKMRERHQGFDLFIEELTETLRNQHTLTINLFLSLRNYEFFALSLARGWSLERERMRIRLDELALPLEIARMEAANK